MSNSFTFSLGNAPHIFLIFSICVYSSLRKGQLMGPVQLSFVLQSVKKYTIIFAFTIDKRKTYKMKTGALVQYFLGAFHSNKNIWFEISATFNSQWDSSFQNFQKRGQPREV